MYVCVCNGVTDRDIENAVASGCRDLADLSARTGCGSTCGCCRDFASELIEQVRSGADMLPVLAAA